jgi:hypothetical protein
LQDVLNTLSVQGTHYEGGKDRSLTHLESDNEW